MDTESYIASGILEGYALGLCSKEEAAEVEKICIESVVIKKELRDVQETLNSYALLHSEMPRESTKATIMKLITSQQDEFSSTNKFEDSKHLNVIKASAEGQMEQESAGQAPIIPIQKPPVNQYFLAAAIALFVLSLSGNIILFTKWQKTENALVALNTERNVLTDNLKTNQVKLDRMNDEMALVNSPATHKVVLKGNDKHPEMLAMVYWNKESKAVYLEIKKLPMPASGKQYQLWAMVDGKPQNAGIINMPQGDTSFLKMKDFSSAQAFAITLEKEGGSPVPDLSQLYVIGSIGS